MYDVISNMNFISKGSSVIRMLEGMLGEEVFRVGLSAYLKRFAFNNAETDDLWAELQTATQDTVDVKKVRLISWDTYYNIEHILYSVINICNSSWIHGHDKQGSQ